MQNNQIFNPPTVVKAAKSVLRPSHTVQYASILAYLIGMGFLAMSRSPKIIISAILVVIIHYNLLSCVVSTRPCNRIGWALLFVYILPFILIGGALAFQDQISQYLPSLLKQDTPQQDEQDPTVSV